MATSSNDPPRESVFRWILEYARVGELVTSRFQAPSSSPQSGRFGFMISIVGDEPHESKVSWHDSPVDTLRRFKAEKASDGGQALDSTTRRPSTYAVTERARSQGPRDSSRSFVPLQEKDESIVQDPTYPNRLDKGLVKASGSYWDTIFSNIDKIKSAGRGAPSEEEKPTPSSPNLGPSILLKSTSGSLGHKPTLSEDAKRARKHWRSAANKVHAVQSLKGVDKTIHQVDNYLQKIDGVLDVLDFTFKNIKEVNQKVEDYGLSVWLNKGNPFG
ncbi:hypothetical protein KEM48_012462 [Puccinia striiformis f. sp. tritici PST-130]|nr:hypothetical protein KEM48_012462 [Puccinia striiformis f. sp. tritici PST-130]